MDHRLDHTEPLRFIEESSVWLNELNLHGGDNRCFTMLCAVANDNVCFGTMVSGGGWVVDDILVRVCDGDGVRY